MSYVYFRHFQQLQKYTKNLLKCFKCQQKRFNERSNTFNRFIAKNGGKKTKKFTAKLLYLNNKLSTI